jgi:hypothetical protein
MLFALEEETEPPGNAATHPPALCRLGRLFITFACLALFAPRNATVLVVLFMCGVSVSTAIFMILEMDGPFDGLLRVFLEPLRDAAAHLNRSQARAASRAVGTRCGCDETRTIKMRSSTGGDCRTLDLVETWACSRARLFRWEWRPDDRA